MEAGSTIFEISRFMLPMNLLIGLVLIFAGSSIIRAFWDNKDRKKSFTAWTAVKLFFSVFAVLVGAVLFGAEADSFFDGDYNAASKAYYSGDYEVIEGQAEDIEWSMGGYSFRIDDTSFFCKQTLQGRQRNDVNEHLDAGKTIHVCYYDGDYFNESLKQYEVVRIDVRTADR